MVSKYLYRSGFIVALVLLSVLALGVEAQDKGCRPARHAKYFKGHSETTAERADEPPGLLLDIAVKPQQVNRAYLLSVAKKLKTRYCKTELLLVNFYDSKEVAKVGLSLVFRSDEAKDAYRGIYYLNRRTGEEYISYTPVPDYNGNPKARIRIDLQ